MQNMFHIFSLFLLWAKMLPVLFQVVLIVSFDQTDLVVLDHASAHGGLSANGLSDICLIFLGNDSIELYGQPFSHLILIYWYQ